MGVFDKLINRSFEKALPKALNSFDWDQVFSTQKENSKISHLAPRPATRDLSEQYTINSDLTRGIWHNTIQGMKLAGSLAYTPIAVPIAFMGLPIPKTKSNNEVEDKYLARIVSEHIDELRQIHLQCHREGTIWVWPYFDAQRGRVVWELIPDETVPTIIRDIQAGDPVEIVTDENLTVQVGTDQQETIRRKRTFTKQRITIEYTGAKTIDKSLMSKTYRNVLGILPIPFANDADGDEVRGHSDYERILSDLKAYHDIEYSLSLLLAKYRPKLVLTVEDVDQFVNNNPQYGTNLADLDVSASDLFLLMKDEKAEILFPQGAHESYIRQKQYIFLKLVEATGVPEIAWGVKTEGNHASAEEQMSVLIKKVEDKRAQKNGPYAQLFFATRLLESIANISSTQLTLDDMQVDWNILESVSDSVRSEIFERFSKGVSSMMDTAGLSMDQLYKLWQMNFPQATNEDFEAWKVGLSQMAEHKRAYSASVLDFGEMATGKNPMDDE
ncbi:MAG: hypothetical protein PVJ39_04580 [Gammaproteobacteria bacterium]|jgi:hypothetical protein